MRALTVCVGISDYQQEVLEQGEAPLEFLAESARNLSSQFAEIWPGPDSKHLLLVDGEASLVKVRAAIAAVGGEYEIFVLYLGGHGRVSAGSFQFIFFSENPIEAIARSTDIDILVSTPYADNVLVLLDGCYAGKFGDETTLLDSAHAGARCLISSSSPTQKSWEDPLFRLSLFADAVIKAFHGSPASNPPAERAIGVLFDQIAADVARHAFALKGSVAQEPIIFGDSSLVIPPSTLKRESKHKRSLTTFETLLRRSRQILLAVAGIVALIVVAVSSATWRPAINDAGHIELRQGPKWLSALNVGPWKLRVETELSSTDLNDSESEQPVRSQLLDERGVHLWPGHGLARVRRWSDIFVNDYLNAETAARWHVWLGYKDAVERLTKIVMPGGGGGLRVPNLKTERRIAVDNATELAAEAKVLNPSLPLPDVWRIQWRREVGQGGCRGSLNPDVGDRIDHYLDLSDPVQFARWLRGVATTAAIDDAVGFEEVITLIEMFGAANASWARKYAATLGNSEEPITAARIASRFTERPTRGEVDALASIASAIVMRRMSKSQEPVSSVERARIVDTTQGCEKFAVPVLASLGNYGDPARVVRWAHGRLSSDQGRPMLRQLAARGALPLNEVSWLLNSLGFSSDVAARKRAFLSASEWLGAVAELMPLGADVLTGLVSYSSERISAGDLQGARQGLSVILRSSDSLNPPFDQQVAALMSQIAKSRGALPPSSADVELMGLLARSGAKVTSEQRDELTKPLRKPNPKEPALIVFTDNDKRGSRLSTQLVAGLTSTDLLAFSRFILGLQKRGEEISDMEVLPFLNRALVDGIRFGVPAGRLREGFAAAAIARMKPIDTGLNAPVICSALRRFPSDAAARRVEVEIAKAAIPLASKSRAQIVLRELRDCWRTENEPEIKLALAEIIIDTAAQIP